MWLLGWKWGRFGPAGGDVAPLMPSTEWTMTSNAYANEIDRTGRTLSMSLGMEGGYDCLVGASRRADGNNIWGR